MPDQQQLSDQSIPERAVKKADALKEPPAPKRAMAISAHPDDQEFTVAGTLAKWARAGCEIVTVCITSGDAGSNEKTDPDLAKHKLAQMREEEQRAACRVLGIAHVEFLHYPDGILQPTLELRRDLTRLIRKYKPEVVLCGDPTVRYYGNSYLNHPDHRAAADAALDAVFPSAGTRFIFPELLAEGFEPHAVNKIFIHGAEKSETYVDIRATLEIKITALKEHQSQLGDWDPAEMMREWARDGAAEHGLEYAESFRVMILKEDEQKTSQVE
ncbi:MAG: PIG-L family deacetylase [Anaerolineales bacterium]|nr:PIG-L family deacetylase [Anaerolineales bacterium]